MRFLKSAVTLLSNMLMKSTNHFSIDYGNPLPLLKGNFQRLEQVIINLIQNACQALRDAKKSILVTTSYDEKREGIIIRVEDEGIGIPLKSYPILQIPFLLRRSNLEGQGWVCPFPQELLRSMGGR